MFPNETPTPRKPARRGISRGKLLAAVLLVFVVGGIGLASLSSRLQFGGSPTGTFLTEKVKRGTLEVVVTESGSLDSANNITLYSEVEGATTIIKIVDEGAKVKKGQVIVELDSSRQSDLLIQQRIAVERAKADLKQAEGNLEITTNQNASDEAAAKLKYELADLDEKQLLKGDQKKQQDELKGIIALAQEDVTRAEDRLDFVKRNNQKGYVNQNNVETERIALEKAKFNLQKAEADLYLYDNFTFRRLQAEKVANKKEFMEEVKRTKLKSEAALAQVQATLTAAKLTMDAEEQKLKKLQDQVAACKITAPQDGEVVYANNQNRDRRGQSDTGIVEGATVRERQAIVYLPDFTQALVNTKIHESKIGLIHAGLPVAVRADAVPGEIYYGEVDTVSTVPISGNWRTPDLKEYTAVIRIQDKDSERIRRLKPGLTAQVEIHVDRVDKALLVPVQAVVERGGKHLAFVLEKGKPVRKEVEVGRTNDVLIQLIEGKSGLHEGEDVVLNPRSLLPPETEIPGADLVGDPSKSKKAGNDKKETDKKPGTSSEPGRGPAAGNSPGSDPRGGAQASLSPGGEERRRPDGQNGSGEGSRGESGRGAGGGRGGNPADRFKQFDKNSDGKLTKEEVPERMQPVFDMLDKNHDGAIDLQEMQAMPRRTNGGGGSPNGAGGGGGPNGGGVGGGRPGGDGPGREGGSRDGGGGGREGGGRRGRPSDAGAG